VCTNVSNNLSPKFVVAVVYNPATVTDKKMQLRTELTISYITHQNRRLYPKQGEKISKTYG
jgi:hypothetical protein